MHRISCQHTPHRRVQHCNRGWCWLQTANTKVLPAFSPPNHQLVHADPKFAPTSQTAAHLCRRFSVPLFGLDAASVVVFRAARGGGSVLPPNGKAALAKQDLACAESSSALLASIIASACIAMFRAVPSADVASTWQSCFGKSKVLPAVPLPSYKLIWADPTHASSDRVDAKCTLPGTSNSIAEVLKV